MFDFAAFSLALAAISVLLAKALHFYAKNQHLTLPIEDIQPLPFKVPSKSGRSARAAYLLSYVH